MTELLMFEVDVKMWGGGGDQLRFGGYDTYSTVISAEHRSSQFDTLYIS